MGAPSAIEGESVVAFVILQPGTAMTVQEVLDYCREALFPRSSSGKAQKYQCYTHTAAKVR